MTTLTKRSGYTLRLLSVILALVLAACGEPDPSTIIPEITLTTNTASLPDGGGEVRLTAIVTNRGTVTSVLFKGDKGPTIAPVTATNAKGEYVATVTITETTTFTAEATGPAGVGKSPTEGTTVNVAPIDPANNPKAPSSSAAVKGFTNMRVTTGAPSGLSVIVADIPGVTGAIDGQVTTETVKSARGFNVVITGGDGVLSFTYPPSSNGRDSFEYTVTKTNRTAKGKINIDIQSVPSSVDVIDGNDDVGDVEFSTKSRILLAKDIDCREDACIELADGQTLAGAMVIDGVTVKNSVKPKIKASIPETRKSGTASCTVITPTNPVPPGGYDPRPNCIETRVLVLNDDTTVEWLEITSESTDEASTYFIAIFGLGDRSPSSTDNVLNGDIKIKDVTINRSNGKPIYIKYTFPNDSNPNPVAPFYGNYNLEIDGLDLNDANDTLVIGNPQKLVFKNSTIDLTQPSGNNAGPQPFGDNSGVQIAMYNDGADITLDNVDVFMQSPRYQIDFGAVQDTCTPIEIYNDSFFNPGVTASVTVKNSDVTFGTTSLNGVYAFKVTSISGTIDIRSDSTNNKSVRSVLETPTKRDNPADPVGVINGNIVVNP